MRLPNFNKKHALVASAGLAFVFSLVFAFSSQLHIAADGSGPYRWRNDNGTEVTATFAADESTTAFIAKNTPTRLRLAAANPGTESELLRQAATALYEGELGSPLASVIDTANGYAYFGVDSTGRIIKVALGAGSASPTRVAAVGGVGVATAVIDAASGYAYFAGGETVYKVALGAGTAAPTVVGSVTLNSGENVISSVIDTTTGYAYFGTNSIPGIVVKVALGAGAAAPTRVNAVPLDTGEDVLRAAVIDTTNGYAYFGTQTSPAIVVKVALGVGAAAPTRTAALTLNTGENEPYSAVIDPGNGYAYFVNGNSTPGRVIKVLLGAGAAAPTRTAALTLSTGDNLIRSAVIDTANGRAYLGVGLGGRVVKIALGAGAAAPTRTAALNSPGITALQTAVINPASGHAYFGGDGEPGRVRKIALGSGAAAPTGVGAVLYFEIPDSVNSGVVDTTNGYAYFGTYSDSSASIPGKVIKVSLGLNGSAPTRVGAIMLNAGEGPLSIAAIDTTNGYAYFSGATAVGVGSVVKVALGAAAAAPTRVGAVSLNSGENPTSLVIDTTNGYAYLGTSASPALVVKVALGAGAAAPTRVGAVTLNSGEDNLSSAVIDTANGYAYFGTNTSPGLVVKVALGAGAALPTRVGAVPMVTGEDQLYSAGIDTTNGYAYFGASVSPGIVVKVALGAGAAVPTRVGAVTLNSGEDLISSAAIDTANGYVYFAANTSPGIVVKVALGSGAAAPTRTDARTLNAGEDVPLASVIDTTNGYIYFASYVEGSPSTVVKFSTAPRAAFRLEYGTKSTTCSAISSWTQVPAVAAGHHWQMADSTNLTDGAATTNNAGLSDPNSSFRAGEVKDTSSQTAITALGERQFTELEFSLMATTDSITGNNYCFRLTDAGSATNLTGAFYPEATIGVPGHSPAASPPPSPPGAPAAAICGNALCEAGETVGSCPTDCFGVTPPEPTPPEPPPEENPNEPPPSQSTQYDPAEEKAEASSISDDLGIEAPATPPLFVLCTPESLIKGSASTVYYCGVDGKRYIFPNEQVFHTWFADFSSTITVSNATLAAIPLGGMIGHRPGVRMVKLTTDDKVYAVTSGAVLRWVATEDVAVLIYGPNWNQFIDDITTEEFSLYTIGAPITE